MRVIASLVTARIALPRVFPICFLQDVAWFENQLRDEMQEHLATDWDDVLEDSFADEATGKYRLLYGDYQVPGADHKVYEEIKDMFSILPKFEEDLADYNSESKVGGAFELTASS